jgi:surface polysaccharide O-acyltransferase-like enzyme
MKGKDNRHLWPDVIKIFAIFGVLTIHTINVYPYWISGFLLNISQTSIPLFVMVSGALLLGKTESYKNFFKKRTLRVLIPWIIWTIVYMFFYFYIIKDQSVFISYFSLGSNPLISWGKFFAVQFLTGLWFLPLIFGIYLLTPILRVFIKKATELDFKYILILWFICISLLPWIFSNAMFPKWNPAIIFSPIQYTGYFILGYYLIKKKAIATFKFKLWYIFPLLLYFWLIPKSGFLDPFIVLGSFIIFIYLMSFSKLIKDRINTRAKNIISFIGMSTLGIYALHELVIQAIGQRLVTNLNIFNLGFFYTIILFIISAIIVWIIQKIPLTKLIVPKL